jgi:hypothetical protein
VFNTLNYEKLNDMDEEAKKKFVLHHVKSVLSGNMKGERKKPIIPLDDERTYDVAVDYTAIDTFYEEHGHLLATLECERIKGKLSVSLISMEYKES